MIHTNPTVLVDVPKIHQKSIIRLEADEVALLLDYIEHGGDDLTGQKKVYYEKNKDHYPLHPDARALLEKLLHMLAEEGEETTFAYIRREVDWKHSLP